VISYATNWNEKDGHNSANKAEHVSHLSD